MQLYKILFVVSILKFATSDGILNTEILNTDVAISSFSDELDRWVKTGEMSQSFESWINILTLPTSMQQGWRSFTGDLNKAACIVCRSALDIFMKHRKEGMSDEKIRSVGIKLCILLNIESERVCNGVVTLNLPPILYIVDERSNLTASTICGVVFESDSCSLNDDEYNWTIDIDNSPGKIIAEKENNKTINIVQITDIHYDPIYEPDGNLECNEPACCRKGQNDTRTGDKLAGFWGDYNKCDTPLHAVVDALYHIKDTHKDVSYIYFTGDLVDHGVWETTLNGNIQIINTSYHLFHQIFRNIPVYPILGNHESQPLNQFAPTTVINNEVSTQWLYNMVADLWIGLGWLPESTRSTILKGGYYTFSPKKGFRIIGLNSNVCYTYNWWIWYQPKDSGNQLQWLADTLLQAEKDGELVHILTHVPPASEECQSTWKKQYLKVIDRFAPIIKAQFNGHTHNDELELLYSSENKKVNNVAWNGGSVTSFTELNPNYKVYTVDSENYVVKDFDNWIYNLSLANENVDERPQWYKSYSFKEEYDISNLSYDSLSDWYSRLSHDNDLLKRYYGHFFKLAEPSLRKKCDIECMRTYIHRIIAA